MTLQEKELLLRVKEHIDAGKILEAKMTLDTLVTVEAVSDNNLDADEKERLGI
jgi:hypothetical protein